MEHIALFHYMVVLHRQGTSTDKAALKLYYAEPLECYKIYLWKDFYWAWNKAAKWAQWDQMGIADADWIKYGQRFLPLPIIDYEDDGV